MSTDMGIHGLYLSTTSQGCGHRLQGPSPSLLHEVNLPLPAPPPPAGWFGAASKGWSHINSPPKS